MKHPRRFQYLADPVCILSLALYALNRFYLKPHHIGGWFTQGYLNDVLSLPLFVPLILRLQRLLGIRYHDDYPRAWEILQQWALFSLVFQVIMPRFPKIFRGAGDPYDMIAYFAGGLLAWLWWSYRARRLCRIKNP